jgi:ferredoxin
MHVSVDRDRCCSSGQCVIIAPEIFDQRDSDGTSYPLQPHPSQEFREPARQAAAVCPTQAITVQD